MKKQFDNPQVSPDGVFQDINGGHLIEGNSFFINLPNAVKMLLFQDEFEIVNPLG